MTLAQGKQVLEILSQFRHDLCEKPCIHEKEPMLLMLLSRVEALIDVHVYHESRRKGNPTSTVAETAASV
jgi:hypothetical protein